MLECIELEDSERALNYEELFDPNHKAVCLIMYFYSMEPPFYQDLNKACREMDLEKVK